MPPAGWGLERLGRSVALGLYGGPRIRSAATRRALQAARDANDRTTRQALARCAERYILGALGYERMGIEGAAHDRTAPSPCRLVGG